MTSEEYQKKAVERLRQIGKKSLIGYTRGGDPIYPSTADLPSRGYIVQWNPITDRVEPVWHDGCSEW